MFINVNHVLKIAQAVIVVILLNAMVAFLDLDFLIIIKVIVQEDACHAQLNIAQIAMIIILFVHHAKMDIQLLMMFVLNVHQIVKVAVLQQFVITVMMGIIRYQVEKNMDNVPNVLTIVNIALISHLAIIVKMATLYLLNQVLIMVNVLNAQLTAHIVIGKTIIYVQAAMKVILYKKKMDNVLNVLIIVFIAMNQ